jgi:hypothetical protein
MMGAAAKNLKTMLFFPAGAFLSAPATILLPARTILFHLPSLSPARISAAPNQRNEITAIGWVQRVFALGQGKIFEQQSAINRLYFYRTARKMPIYARSSLKFCNFAREFALGRNHISQINIFTQKKQTDYEKDSILPWSLVRHPHGGTGANQRNHRSGIARCRCQRRSHPAWR